MSGIVTSLSGSSVINERGVNDNCVEQLERLLQKARDGEIVGVASAIQYADGSTSWCKAGFLWTNSVIGSLTILVHRLMEDD